MKMTPMYKWYLELVTSRSYWPSKERKNVILAIRDSVKRGWIDQEEAKLLRGFLGARSQKFPPSVRSHRRGYSSRPR